MMLTRRPPFFHFFRIVVSNSFGELLNDFFLSQFKYCIIMIDNIINTAQRITGLGLQLGIEHRKMAIIRTSAMTKVRRQWLQDQG